MLVRDYKSASTAIRRKVGFNFVKREPLILAGALLLAALLKLALVLAGSIPFNSDEAVVALMARHILSGERPIFFYGQVYMGSLDAWLVAAGFWILGEQVWVIRLVQTFLFLGLLLATASLGKLILGSKEAAILATWLMAIPTINVTLYTTASLGGYGEALLLGAIMLGISWILGNHSLSRPRQFLLGAIWGVAAGLGVWAFGLSLVYTLPTGVYIIFKHGQMVRRKKWRQGDVKVAVLLVCMAAGVLIGASPWWWFALQNGGRQLIWELSGGAIFGVEGLSFGIQIGQHLLNLMLLGVPVILGMRPPWGVTWLGLPLIPLVLAFWGWVIVFTLRELRRDGPRREALWLLISIPILTIVGFVFTPFGADPSGRYFLPMAIPMSLIAAEAIREISLGKSPTVSGLARFRAVGAIILICGYHLLGTYQSAVRYPPGITTQFNPVTQVDQRHLHTLADFLRSQGETRGYTNYWVAYPLSFVTQEELIYTPELAYHLDFRYTARDNRYPKYIELVEQSSRTAYITTNHPPLDSYLRSQFQRLGVTWSETLIGDYHVFYQLSSPVHARDIGLGVTANGLTERIP